MLFIPLFRVQLTEIRPQYLPKTWLYSVFISLFSRLRRAADNGAGELLTPY